ncbi:MAG: pyruvate kinase [Gloeocapsa sp. DLM2.Bin57]|nr:MAG: pyruvate kinase [Gloeocapsa sp. DLM2.Bin57]
MKPITKRTKIVATIGPASSSREVLKQMIEEGMNVARLNFSHGDYENHEKMVKLLRSVEEELDTPITLLQDLQGPKIRIGQLSQGEVLLTEGDLVSLIPVAQFQDQPNTLGIDYPDLAVEAKPGAQILLDDGLLELVIKDVHENKVICEVVEGGILKSRKGVNLPSLNLKNLPSLTEKDKRDLDFGLTQGIDWVSLSFVRSGEDIRALKALLAEKGYPDVPVMAKIEKPQAIDNLPDIISCCDGLMVARGDLGVEMKPEKVPLLQKRIIQMCNQKGIPVITATQMLDSMIRNPRPTRAEASDVANAILDGTDAVMLSGESAVGKYPVRSVKMLAKIATDIEQEAKFINYIPEDNDQTHALSESLNAIDRILPLRYIVTFTATGYSALIASGERPKAPVVAFTHNVKVYHRLNLIWGVMPILIEGQVQFFEELIEQAESGLLERNLAQPGDMILIMGGIPAQTAKGTNFLKLHKIKEG